LSELRVEDLTFAYAGMPPLFEHVSFSVRSGEFVVIVGGNGSGKTTLLKILAGLAVPRHGRVWIDQADNDRRGAVGLLFQNPEHQMIASTVEEEIALGLELRGADPEFMRVEVEALLSRFALTDFRLCPPEALSGGQKQRVALAATMVTHPSFLLLDEPDSFLDAPSRRELMSAVSESRKSCGLIWMTPNPRRMPEADGYFLLSDRRLTPTSRAELLALAEP
jgi:energy-coupling factor transport system ATP-binding protein